MKVVNALLAVIAAATVAVQAGHIDILASRHNHLARAPAAAPTTRKTCRSTANNTKKPKTKPAPKPAAPKTTPSSGNSGGTAGGGGGPGHIIADVKSSCGNPGATAKTTKTTGPNGSINWLNCGINNGGWRPADIHVSNLVSVDLSEALKDPNSPFKACSSYVSMFEQYGNEFGVPAILLASFAMQESSCNPATVGGGGEQGLMQITKDKCGGAPGGNCRDPRFNIRTGAHFFSQTLADNGGNVLTSIGMYNGWYPGLTYAKATAARHSSCCRCQNNLDYLHQFLNGWLQNIDAYSSSLRLGEYFNLDVCN
jgi:hypothetical protein